MWTVSGGIMGIQYIEGDLFASLEEDTDPGTIILPHVCNNRGAFGAGFVVPLADKFPSVMYAYLDWYDRKIFKSVKDCLVEYSSPNFGPGQVQFIEVVKKDTDNRRPRIIVANMIAQNLGGKRPLSYKYLIQCMEHVEKKVFMCGCMDSEGVSSEDAGYVRIVAPMFGSGLAGGDWNFIEKLIEDCWKLEVPIRIHYFFDCLPNNWQPPEGGLYEFEKGRL